MKKSIINSILNNTKTVYSKNTPTKEKIIFQHIDLTKMNDNEKHETIKKLKKAMKELNQ